MHEQRIAGNLLGMEFAKKGHCSIVFIVVVVVIVVLLLVLHGGRIIN